ncbi:protein kinase [Vitiosangium sp. GDMCC 1.1324]|uniref:serine/threonine protein kinase n=1 Tax=Vitiosangium sp. (strain GDMCC 1.1324) TaxID=2138576 RepID=UPI000D3529A8|nr:protein kinase [Vitiosangium sp. GDMCC 1.1324]PTL80926.1 serine/threonine protein kinase [Vitiosangium sp. GDMCC 1.1324]
MSQVRYYTLGPLIPGEGSRPSLALALEEGGAPQPVVLVWAPQEVVQDAAMLSRLQRETQRAVVFEHPNILRVHGLVTVEGRVARVTEFADGEPLRQVLDVGGRLPIEFALLIAADVAKGVHYAHVAGNDDGTPLIHGDLRPETVMVSFNGVCKVSGYGALGVAPRERNGRRVRNRRLYSAPEQLMGGREASSVLTDVFLLGLLLYECLSGRKPFQDSIEPDKAILNRPLPPLPPEVPLGLNEVVRRATAKRSGERYPSALAFREALVAVAGELPTSTAFGWHMARLFPTTNEARVARKKTIEKGLADLARGVIPTVTPPAHTPAPIAGAPRTPSLPGVPVIPPSPSLTGVPVAPATPSLPGVPVVPPTQSQTAVPVASPTPSLTRVPAAPATPSLPGVPVVPPAQSQPAVPVASPTPSLPGVPVVPATPGQAGAQASPATPSLPGVPVAPPAASATPPAEAQAPVDPVPPPPPAAPVATSARPRRSAMPLAIGVGAVLLVSAMGTVWSIRKKPELMEPEDAGETEAAVKFNAPVLIEAEPVDAGVRVANRDAGPSAPVIAPTLVELVVNPEVAVSIDGRAVGRSPLKVPLAPGRHTLTLTDETKGLRTARMIDVRATPDPVSFTIRLGMGSVLIHAPTGSRVSLDGEDLGTAPVSEKTLFEGEHRMKVTLNESVWEKTFALPGDQRLVFNVNFEAE